MATNNPSDMPDLTTDGQLLIGNTAGRPSAATLTAGSFTKVTNGAGSITFDLSDNAQNTSVHGWNGSILETPSITVTSNGSAITFSIEKSGGGDLILVFSDGYTTFDTTPAATISLTAGTDTVPVLSYVYIPQSTKILTVSTTSFPSAEHIPLATVLCQTAASLQTDGAYKVHAWTDHVVASDNQGHISHLNAWIRGQNATWQSGVGQTFTITTNGGAADNVILTTVAGVVLQVHDHTFPAFSGTPDIYVVNDSVTPYKKVTDLNALLTDSAGVSMSSKFFSLVIWGVVNESASDCKLFVNLPSGSYNNATGVTLDPDSFANFAISTNFRGTGFLIAQWNLRHQPAASGTWTSIDEIDLRGLLPAIEAGGATASTSEFIDTAFRVLDDGDNTKEIAFQASGITTATTRTFTAPDASGTLVITSDFDTNDFAVATNDVSLANRTRLVPGYVENLGINYAVGTGVFTVLGADASLGAANPGFVTVASAATPGQLIVHEITADQAFIDDNGSSEIIDNLFGFVTSIAVTDDIPFYIYAVTNDSDDAIAFMISRVPGQSQSPVTASIGAPDDAVADNQYSFFSFDNITETEYDTNPCTMIGSFRMRMSASDDWTVQTLDDLDGIGRFQENRFFDMPTGQFGAATGKYFQDNGGTAPAWGTNVFKYQVNPFLAICHFQIILTDISTQGLGVVTSKLVGPYITKINQQQNFGIFMDNSVTQRKQINLQAESANNNIGNIYFDNSNDTIDNDEYDTDDDLFVNGLLYIANSA